MTLVIGVAVLVLLLVVAGRLWAHLPLQAGRAAAWIALLASVTAVGFVPWDAIPRMIALCCVLLAAMKGLTYVEWCAAGRRALPWKSYLIFSLLWFGMNPGSFARRVRGLEIWSHWRIGLACTVAGLLLSVLVRSANWTPILVLFVPLSLAFHYGVLRMLTGAWRTVGFPVRVLFRNPLASRGLGDFWGARWNLGYSQMMARVVMRPSERYLGATGARLAVFFVSGVLHKVAITLPVRAGYGLPTLYFVLQAFAVLAERWSWVRRWARLWALLWVTLPLPLLFPAPFREEVILPILRLFPDISGLLSA